MKRLVSLDFFRGLTIALMIIVNTPGSWGHVYPPLLHAEWHGLTPTDLVFPFFLFIVGVSIVLAYANKKHGGHINRATYVKIVRRTITIILLGLFLALFPKFNFANIRIVGVLFRIALVFGFCAVLYLNTNWKTQLWIGISFLLSYFIFLCFIPFGQSTAGVLEPGNNFAAWVDSFITPGRMYRETWDPEGLFSTIPAFGTGISGMLIGQLLLNKKMSSNTKIIWMFTLGLVAFSIGHFWGYLFPVNKHIWTSSYVMVSSGLAAMFFAASIWIIDEQGYRKWTKLGVVFGMNAITAYVLHGIVFRLFQLPIGSSKGLQFMWMDGLSTIGMAPKLASLLWAIAYMLLIYLFALALYRRKIFIKV